VPEDTKEEHLEQHEGFVVPSPLGYPRHGTSFETYYYLGESRTLRLASLIRFKQLVPDCPENSPTFKSKFESFYTKIKRWAKGEDWQGWVIRKDVEERQKYEKELKQKTVSQDKTLRMYQSLLRQSLVVFSDKIRVSVELRNALNVGDDEKIAMLMAKERLEIKSFAEAKLVMDYDLELEARLENLPSVKSEEHQKLVEDEREKLDRTMESIRKRASEEGHVDDDDPANVEEA